MEGKECWCCFPIYVDFNGEVEGKELEVFIPVDSYGEVEGKTY